MDSKQKTSSEAEDGEEESISDPEVAESKINPRSPKSKRKVKKAGAVKLKKPRIIINVLNTEYEIVKEIMQRPFGYKISFEPEGEWDLLWADTGVTNDMLCRMKKYQKINHYPSMGCLARKNNLGKNLMRMRKEFPKEYNFFPPTWLLPYEGKEFRSQFGEKKCKTFIVKPEALSQGKGIFLTRTWENISSIEHCVVQRYIHKPYLIDGLKFDLRIYVLVYGCDPLRVFIFKEGLARLATDPYIPPAQTNLTNLFMHLTNYAINKNSENFVFNTDADKADVGHKRSLTFIWKYIDDHGGNSKELQLKIRDSIIKTLCAVQPQLADSYRSCQPNDDKNDKCFEILGFDVLLDHKLKPWLLEVNHSPSFTTDTPFDVKVKSELLTDTLNILHMNPNRRIKFYKQKDIDSQNRRLGKNKGIPVKKITKEERAEHKRRHMDKRDKYEVEHCGSYTRIYPDPNDPNKYNSFLDTARRIWDEFFVSKRKVKKEPEPPLAPKPIQRPVARKLAAVGPKKSVSDVPAMVKATVATRLAEASDNVNNTRSLAVSRKYNGAVEANGEQHVKIQYQSINAENMPKYTISQHNISPPEHEFNVYFPLISKLPHPFQKMKLKGSILAKSDPQKGLRNGRHPTYWTLDARVKAPRKAI